MESPNKDRYGKIDLARWVARYRMPFLAPDSSGQDSVRRFGLLSRRHGGFP